jgi:hypothetical protein
MTLGIVAFIGLLMFAGRVFYVGPKGIGYWGGYHLFQVGSEHYKSLNSCRKF